MSQLIDNLNIIESVKTDIKAALENKGVDMTDVSFPGYASKIGEISGGGGVKPSGTLEISENGVYDVYSYASASVDVHPSTSLSETYISNGSYNITGEFNGGVITVYVPAPQFVTETLNVSANGTYNPGQGVDGYSQVVVDVPQSVIGINEKDATEGRLNIVNLNNSASYVASYIFNNNSILQTINLLNCISIGSSAFYSCSNLVSVSLPECNEIGSGAFYRCGFSEIYLPECKRIYETAFANCSNLSYISLPKCEYISGPAFGALAGTFEKTKISSIFLPVCSFIGANVFKYTEYLTEITLGYSSVCSLNNSNTFNNTQITSSTGSIYVPVSLVDAYKSAKNWSYFSNRIFPIV